MAKSYLSTNVHAVDTAEIQANLPSSGTLGGWLTIDDLTIFPPHSPEDAVDFWDRVATAAKILLIQTKKYNELD